MGKDGAPVSINHLSEQEQISSVFLEQIFFKLRKAGIVASVRGPGGGFYFAQPLDKLTIKAILDAAGEELESVSCDKRQEACQRIGICPSHEVWTDVTSLVNDFFKNLTLASLLEKNALPDLPCVAHQGAEGGDLSAKLAGPGEGAEDHGVRDRDL
jgi:Rrf2 family iron-sulfur cluster assembly transcriptional regulator